jgi:hypothetical protein
MIDATERLTATIAGIQDAPPNKMEAIQSLRILLLGKVAPLPPPALSIFPTPQKPTPLFDIDKLVIIWNPQVVQTSPFPLKHNTNDIIPNCNTPAIVEDNSEDDTPIPNHSMCPLCHHLIHPLQNLPLRCNQLQLCTAHIINSSLRTSSCPHLHFALIHLCFIADMCLRLNASSWKQFPHPLTPPFTSFVPSLMRTQAMSLNINTL